MAYRVRLDIAGLGAFYPAYAPYALLLTRLPDKARRYHNMLNATSGSNQWVATLADLGHTVTPTIEEWTEE